MTRAQKTRKSALRPPSPEEMRRRRDAADTARLLREAAEAAKARQPEGFGVNEASLSLAQNAGTEIRRDGHGKARSLWRSNPFKLLLDSGALSHDDANAAHDLIEIYARSKGLAGAPAPSGVVVDGGNPDAWGAEDRRQYNIRLIALIMDSLSLKSAALARAFCLAIVEQDRPLDWRAIVAQTIGEAARDRQTTRMQVLCEELCERIPTCRKALKAWAEGRGG